MLLGCLLAVILPNLPNITAVLQVPVRLLCYLLTLLTSHFGAYKKLLAVGPETLRQVVTIWYVTCIHALEF